MRNSKASLAAASMLVLGGSVFAADEPKTQQLRALAPPCTAAVCRVPVWIFAGCRYLSDDVDIAKGNRPTIVWVLMTTSRKVKFSLDSVKPGVVITPPNGYVPVGGTNQWEFGMKDDGTASGIGAVTFNIKDGAADCSPALYEWNPTIKNNN